MRVEWAETGWLMKTGVGSCMPKKWKDPALERERYDIRRVHKDTQDHVRGAINLLAVGVGGDLITLTISFVSTKTSQ